MSVPRIEVASASCSEAAEAAPNIFILVVLMVAVKVSMANSTVSVEKISSKSNFPELTSALMLLTSKAGVPVKLVVNAEDIEEIQNDSTEDGFSSSSHHICKANNDYLLSDLDGF